MFHKRMSMAKSSEHAAGPFMASAYRIRQFSLFKTPDFSEKFLTGRPHVSLWLGKTYVVPAGMYGGQVWGTSTEDLRCGSRICERLTSASHEFFEEHIGCQDLQDSQ